MPERSRRWQLELAYEPDPDREIVSIGLPVAPPAELLGTPMPSLRVVPTGQATCLVVGLETVGNETAALVTDPLTAVAVECPPRRELEFPTGREGLEAADPLWLSIPTQASQLS